MIQKNKKWVEHRCCLLWAIWSILSEGRWHFRLLNSTESSSATGHDGEANYHQCSPASDLPLKVLCFLARHRTWASSPSLMRSHVDGTLMNSLARGTTPSGNKYKSTWNIINLDFSWCLWMMIAEIQADSVFSSRRLPGSPTPMNSIWHARDSCVCRCVDWPGSRNPLEHILHVYIYRPICLTALCGCDEWPL